MSLIEILQRCRYGDLEFPVTELSQRGGRRVGTHGVWGRHGEELVDGARTAYKGKVTAAFFDNIEGYGDDLFPRRLEFLVRAFETTAEDRFAHPLLGTFRAMITDWEPRLSSKWQNGAYLDFEWVEQRASVVGVVALDLERGEGDPRAALATQAAAADAAVAAAGVTLTKPLTPVATATLATVAAPQPYTEVTRALATVEAAAADARAMLRVVAVTGANALALYQARAAVARVVVANGRLRAALLPDPSRARTFTPTRAMTFAEVALAVYGDPLRARDLRAANATARDVVPPGRTVRVLP